MHSSGLHVLLLVCNELTKQPFPFLAASGLVACILWQGWCVWLDAGESLPHSSHSDQSSAWRSFLGPNCLDVLGQSKSFMLELKNLRDLPEVNWVRISDQALKKAFASAAQPRRRIIGKQSEGRLAMTRVKLSSGPMKNKLITVLMLISSVRSLPAKRCAPRTQQALLSQPHIEAVSALRA